MVPAAVRGIGPTPMKCSDKPRPSYDCSHISSVSEICTYHFGNSVTLFPWIWFARLYCNPLLKAMGDLEVQEAGLGLEDVINNAVWDIV